MKNLDERNKDTPMSLEDIDRRISQLKTMMNGRNFRTCPKKQIKLLKKMRKQLKKG